MISFPPITVSCAQVITITIELSTAAAVTAIPPVESAPNTWAVGD